MNENSLWIIMTVCEPGRSLFTELWPIAAVAWDLILIFLRPWVSVPLSCLLVRSSSKSYESILCPQESLIKLEISILKMSQVNRVQLRYRQLK